MPLKGYRNLFKGLGTQFKGIGIVYMNKYDLKELSSNTQLWEEKIKEKKKKEQESFSN